MSLELSGTTGLKGVAGSVAAPSIVGDDTNTGISFPAADTIKFSTGGVERISITNSGISGTGISAGGKFASYALIADQKAANTAGGTFTNGSAGRTRDLNTEISDPDSIVSLSSNQFTLQAGSYLIIGHAPAFLVGRHMAYIYDVTGSAVQGYFGTAEYSTNTQSFSKFQNKVTITSANVFEIRHWNENTRATNGFGVNTSNYTNTYTVVEIYKES